jgi:hypothetical protein
MMTAGVLGSGSSGSIQISVRNGTTHKNEKRTIAASKELHVDDRLHNLDEASA